MQPIIELRGVSKAFGTVVALQDVNFAVQAGEVHCLLGDNGAGKSTLIKILAGVHRPSGGEYLIDCESVQIASPREALDRGIGTVYQDLAMIQLLSITRNFFLGREPRKGWGPFARFDSAHADHVVVKELAEIGILYTGVDSDLFKVFLGLMVLMAVLFNNYVRRRATQER